MPLQPFALLGLALPVNGDPQLPWKISVVLSMSSKLAPARADTDFVPFDYAPDQSMLQQGWTIPVLD